jgi:hypothetical protein
MCVFPPAVLHYIVVDDDGIALINQDGRQFLWSCPNKADRVQQRGNINVIDLDLVAAAGEQACR